MPKTHAAASHGRQIVAGIIGAALFAGLWLVFAPSQLGGSATYSITEGVSMEPLLHKDNLALVRPQSTYKVGDVVLYQSPTLHRPVLHRIIVIQNGHYFFKGDNNGFVDPGYATRSELTGKLWLHVPYVGGVLGWIGTPSHAAALGGLTVLILLLGGASTTRRRGKRRVGPVIAPQKAFEPTATRARYLTPMTRASLGSVTALALLGLVLTAAAFAAPSSRPKDIPDSYQQTGAFSYSAHTAPSSTYPTGVAVTGQPLFARLVRSVHVGFSYRFVSKLPHHIRGTIEFKALVLARSSTWTSLFPIEKKRPFSGDTARVGGTISLVATYAFFNQLSAAAGTPGAEYSVDLQPVVHIVGTVGGKPINMKFEPALPFDVTPTVVRLDVAPVVAPPGATYAPPTAEAQVGSSLRPVLVGTLPGRGPNYLTAVRYHFPVSYLRLAGPLLLLLAALVALFHEKLVRRDAARPVEELIAADLGCFVAPVDALVTAEGAVTMEMSDFRSLARLARYLERPILEETDDGGRTYVVEDDARVYRFRAPALEPIVRPAKPLRALVPRTSRRPSSRVAIVSVAGVLLIAVTLVTSFTATTTVPTSNAGASSESRTLASITPGGCASLSLTSISVRSGAFTNSSSHVLVLGSAGVDNITDHGASNCIVGGGGKDTVNGVSTDICIVGPGSGMTYKLCKQA
jgi:signal peptidase I